MKHFFVLILCLVFPFLGFSQDYKQHLNLSYAELDSLVYVEYNKGAFDKAIPYLEAGREKSKNEFGEQDSVFVQYVADLGFFYSNIGEHDKALSLLIESVKIKEKVLGTAHPEFANSLNNLASLHQDMGDYEKAVPLLIQAKQTYEKAYGVEHPSFATSLNNLAVLYWRMEDYDKALPLYIQAKSIKEKVLGIEDPSFASSLNNLATLHWKMGNYDKALPLMVQAIEIEENILGIAHPEFATSLSNLAALYWKMEDYEKALPLLIQAIGIQEKALGMEHPKLARSLSNLAALYEDIGTYEKGLPLYIEAISIFEKKLGKAHPEFANSINNLAVLHAKMGNYKKALPLYIQAIEIQEKLLGVTHTEFIRSLNNLADLYKNMGDYEQAWNLLHQVMSNLSSLNLEQTFNNSWLDSMKMGAYPSTDHIIQMVNALKTIDQLLTKDKSIANAQVKQIIIADLATALLSKARNEVSNDKDKLRMLSFSNDWLLRSLEVLSPETNIKEAFNRTDQNKSVLLLQATKSEAVYRLGELPDSLIREDKKLLKRQSQLQAKLIEKRSKEVKDSLRNELNHVNQDMDEFIKGIKKNYPKYHKLKYQDVQAKVEDVQALLDDNTALLEYVIGDSVVHIFYIDKQGIKWKKSFGSNEKLTDNIKAFHWALSNFTVLAKNPKKAYSSYVTQAHWFYEYLIAPALADKPNIKNLIIVTDGELGHLPFETFLVEEAPQELTEYQQLHYLVNDFNISYNYSATLWKENKEALAPKNNGQMLAIAANYDIKLDSSMMDLRLPTDQSLRKGLLPLPNARKEVELLQEKYQGFFAFDTLASEKVVKEKASAFAVLHFATHGILDSERPILSSLVLTEDNDSIESNFWQAHEISKIELNANLVVLSACETGFGKFEKGNGIASLARAFMYAGASSLIVSLWQVNDYATAEIMKNLYENLANEMKIDEALRQAKLQYMKTVEGILAHPAFWSPFIQMGNTNTVYLKKKGGASPWMIGLGVLALLGIGGFLMNRSRKLA